MAMGGASQFTVLQSIFPVDYLQITSYPHLSSFLWVASSLFTWQNLGQERTEGELCVSSVIHRET